MKTLNARDPEALAIITRELARDLREVLEWLTIALGCAALLGAIYAVGNVIDRDWFSLAFDLLSIAIFTSSAIKVAKRASKYHMRSKR